MCEQEQEVSELGQTAADTGRAEQRSHSRSDWTESWPGMVAPRPRYRTARHVTGQETGRDTRLMKSCLRHERRDLILSPRQAVWSAEVKGSSATGRLAADLRGSRTESRS